jgi:hypothetical protein
MLPETTVRWAYLLIYCLAASAERAARRANRHRGRLAALLLLVICLAIIPGALTAGSGAPLAASLSQAGAPTAHPTKPAPTKTAATASGFSQAIEQENQQPGSADWNIPPERTATNEIQAYLGATSVAPGDTLVFYVSVQHPGLPYTIHVYRLGWYGGAGGRLMLTTQQIGQWQGYYDVGNGALVGCGTCHVDTSSGLVEANWQPSFELTIPPNWLSGVYVAQFTEASGKQTAVTFDVRGNPHSTYVVVTTDTTVQAYNEWGGYSLYLARHSIAAGHASKVSFDRPVTGWGTVQGLLYEIDGIRWIERMGYDVSYISSVDLHEHPEQLLGHRGFLDFGHDEYWSKRMRDGVEHARDAGVGLAFIGANTAYWQIRFEPDGSGRPDHTIVCYKRARGDPLFSQDRSQVTVEWRDAVVGRPENELLGEMYSNWTSPPRGFPWQVSWTANSPLLDGTGLQPGQKYGCDLVGYEWDKVFANGDTPANLQILSVSQVRNLSGQSDNSNTTAYSAASGALVFDAGSVKWDYALDDLRLFPDRWCTTQHAPIPGMQKLLANVLAAFLAHRS